MKTLILSLATLVLWQSAGQAASRTWTSRKGVQVKAEFTGVKDGLVVLKLPGNIRRQVRLSDFSLEDRDYLVEQLTKRNRPKDMNQLLQLMAFENAVPVVVPDDERSKTNNGNDEIGYEDGSRESDPLNSNVRGQTVVEKEMYGLPMPSPELIVEDKVRTWESLSGLKQLATFDRVLAPGFLRLKKADGTKDEFAIVNFVKEDIEHVKKVLADDMARPVFPEGPGFQSLTPEEVSKGYRVWTDRKNVPLVGKFIAVKGRDVVIEVDGENKEYPKAGLSEADLKWVNNEIRRRAEEAAAKAQASSGGSSRPGSPFSSRPTFPRPPRFGVGGHGGGGHADAGGHEDGGSSAGRFGTGGSGTRPFGMFQYKFNCEHCGRSWTESTPISHCPDCKGKSFFQCHRCGHKWTRTDGSIIDHCPKCSGQIGNGGNSGHGSGVTQTQARPTSNSGRYSSSNTSTTSESSSASTSSTVPSVSGGSPSGEGSGVWMTILYVTLGLSLLGGIAGGLFRAFG